MRSLAKSLLFQGHCGYRGKKEKRSDTQEESKKKTGRYKDRKTGGSSIDDRRPGERNVGGKKQL